MYQIIKVLILNVSKEYLANLENDKTEFRGFEIFDCFIMSMDLTRANKKNSFSKQNPVSHLFTTKIIFMQSSRYLANLKYSHVFINCR